jgi:hypothetical protein|uniref:Uncharacterized protein n=1 Tax=viral metagenome TaxID=1070528 RepID=A0A6C0ITS7_9ZZZZ
MDRALSTAIIGAIVNIILSTIIPCLLKKHDMKKGSFLTEVKLVFMVHRHILITSSVITAIAIYLAVKMEPEVVSSLPPGLINFLNSPM